MRSTSLYAGLFILGIFTGFILLAVWVAESAGL